MTLKIVLTPDQEVMVVKQYCKRKGYTTRHVTTKETEALFDLMHAAYKTMLGSLPPKVSLKAALQNKWQVCWNQNKPPGEP